MLSTAFLKVYSIDFLILFTQSLSSFSFVIHLSSEKVVVFSWSFFESCNSYFYNWDLFLVPLLSNFFLNNCEFDIFLYHPIFLPLGGQF